MTAFVVDDGDEVAIGESGREHAIVVVRRRSISIGRGVGELTSRPYSEKRYEESLIA